MFVFTQGATPIRFFTNNTESARITSSGNVGIGTTSPVAALNIGNNGNIRIDGNTSGGGIYASSNGSNNTFSLTRQDGVNVGDLSISGYSGVGITGGRSSSPATSGYSFYVKSDGNVGIGTTSPKSKLDVNGGVKIGDDTDTASADKVGTLKYRVSGNNSYVDMCMQTGATTYAWINIVQNNW